MLPELSEIQKRRRKLGLNQVSLARLAGVSQSLIAKLESGKIDPSYGKARDIFEALERAEQESGENLFAKDILTKNIISVDKSRPVSEAAKLMDKYNVSQLPVFDKSKNAVGSISDETLLSRLSSGQPLSSLHKTKIEDVMDEPFPRVVETTPLSVINALLQHNKAVLITKKESVVGLITKANLLSVVK